MTKNDKYIKDIKEFLYKYFETLPYKHVNYVEEKGYSLYDNKFIIKTKNAGFVFISPEWSKYGYCIYTQKHAYRLYDEKENIFEFAFDKRFKKNNLLCQKGIDIIKNFILSEYESTL